MNEPEKKGDWINERWVRIPIELLTDQRLTFRHIKVLLALALSRNEKSLQCNPSRGYLANFSGIHVSHISRITRELCELGWISKKGTGGKNMRNNYQLLNPITQTRADSATQTRADSARRKEQENKKQKEQYASLAELGVSENVIKDFILLRKQKRAPITKTSLDGIKREAAKAGCTVEDAISICCERGWAGFNAEWIANKAGGSSEKKSTKEWILSAAGIEERGKELGIIMAKTETFIEFKTRVYQAKGITPEMVRKAEANQREFASAMRTAK